MLDAEYTTRHELVKVSHRSPVSTSALELRQHKYGTSQDFLLIMDSVRIDINFADVYLPQRLLRPQLNQP